MALNPAQLSLVAAFQIKADETLPKQGTNRKNGESKGELTNYDYQASFSTKGTGISMETGKTPSEAIAKAMQGIGAKRPKRLTVQCGFAKIEPPFNSFSHMMFEDPSTGINL